MDNFSIIADPNTSQSTLIDAIQNLGSVTEDPEFWTAIANGDQYSQDHRRRAIFALFQRHVSVGKTLGELAQLLDHPTWLADSDVQRQDILGGRLPVQWTSDDSIIILHVFKDLPDGVYTNWAIYLRVAGKIEPTAVSELLREGTGPDSTRNAEILEFALVPASPANTGS